ncbi:hypothetical protein V6N13_108426 [Hibiscus sabdariffa]
MSSGKHEKRETTVKTLQEARGEVLVIIIVKNSVDEDAIEGRDDEAHLACATDEEPALMMTISQEGTHTRRVQEDAVLLSEERLLPETYHNDKNEESKDVWYLDNGASNHMTGHREKFQELDESITGKVKFGDK